MRERKKRKERNNKRIPVQVKLCLIWDKTAEK